MDTAAYLAGAVVMRGAKGANPKGTPDPGMARAMADGDPEEAEVLLSRWADWAEAASGG